jgi:hypothetical protein
MIKNVYWSSSEVLLFFLDFNETWIFRAYIKKILKHQISWKPTHCFMRIDGQADGWTEMTKLIVTFSNFVKAPNK